MNKPWYDFFVLGKEDFSGVREEIKDSWMRTKNEGVDVHQQAILERDELEQKLSIERMHYLIDIVRPYMIDLFNIIKESGFMITLTDKEGIILDTYISPNILGKTDIKVMSLNEKRVGTNAMGTCLYLDRPFETCGWENAHKAFHEFTTSAAPIHDSEGKLIGCIGITGYADTFSLHTLGMVIAVTYAIENQLKLSKIHSSNDFFHSYSKIIHQSVSDGIIVTDRQGKIASLNKVAEGLFLLSEKELVGKKFDDVVSYNSNLENDLKKNKDFYQKNYILDFGKGSVECITSVTHLKEGEKITGRIYIIKKMKDSIINRDNRENRNKLYSFEDIIGRSAKIKEAVDYARIVSRGNSNVLLLGESGTGKELFAQAIHNNSDRRNKPFVALNCGALPLSLAESELFGYEGGSFTGSKKQGQPGKFELADGGTLFLDEIGEMPLSIQASLLRVIQDREIIRIGGTKGNKVDVMIIAATNKNLVEEVYKNNFRMDLFYRLNVFNIIIPPLRERKEDIPILVDHFIDKYNERFSMDIQGIDNETYHLLINYGWHGNVRELENIIERAVQIAAKNVITPRDIPIYLRENLEEKQDLIDISFMERKEIDAIVEALKRTKGNVKSASKTLGIGRATIYRKLSKYSINIEQYRKQQ